MWTVICLKIMHNILGLRWWQQMKDRVADAIKKAGFDATEKEIRKIIYWNRQKHCESSIQEVKMYL